MSEGQPVLGRFVWHDLMTSDVDKAVAFYTELFGWGIKEADMGGWKYRMIQAGGTEHGGFAPLEADRGLPSHWVSYCTVDDVDAAVARSEKLGGRTFVPGSDIPGTGRFAVIADPQGAVISPFKPNAWGGDSPMPTGPFCWDELMATDPAAAAKFYGEVFGWKTEAQDMGGGMTYHLWKRANGYDAGGMMKKPEGVGPAVWLPYVAVDDADASAARVPQLGGQVCVPPTDIPNVGRFAVFNDPTGATTAILKPIMPA